MSEAVATRSHWQKLPLSVTAQVADIAFRTLGLILLARILPAADIATLIVWGTVCAFGSAAIGLGGVSNAAIQIARDPAAARATFGRLAGLRLRLWCTIVPLMLGYALLREDPLVLPVLFGLVLLVGGAGLLSGGSQGVLGLGGALDAQGLVVRDSVLRALASLLGLACVGTLWLAPGWLPVAWIPLFPLLAGACFFVLAWPRVRARLRGDAPAPATGPLLRAIAPLWLYVALGLVQAEALIFVLDTYVPPSELGVYGVTARIGAILLLPATTLGRLLAPKVAAPAASERERLARLGPTLRFSALTLLPAGVLLALGLADLLLLPLGAEYAEGARYLRILSLQLVTTSLAFVPALWLAVQRVTGLFTLGLVAGAASSIGLGLVLIPAHGAQGAAWAQVLSLWITQIVHAAGFWRCLRSLGVRCSSSAGSPACSSFWPRSPARRCCRSCPHQSRSTRSERRCWSTTPRSTAPGTGAAIDTAASPRPAAHCCCR